MLIVWIKGNTFQEVKERYDFENTFSKYTKQTDDFQGNVE